MTNVINMILNHAEFGNGQLKEFLGDSIVVRFANGNETLPFPQAFEHDLKTLNEDDAKKIEEIKQRWEALALEAEAVAAKQEKQTKEEKANAAPTGFKKFTLKVSDTFKKLMPKKKEAAPAEEAKTEETAVPAETAEPEEAEKKDEE